MKRKTIIILVVILLTLALAFFIVKKFVITGKVVEAGSEKSDWLVENCECIERENLRCNSGFKLNKEDRICVRENDGSITNVVLGCSKYECGDEIWRIK